MRNCLAIIFLVIPSISQATTVVAVIDTGINPIYTEQMCPYGHTDLTETNLDDVNGHGTNISGIIHNLAKDYDYCQVIIKYYHEKSDNHTIDNTIRALRIAMKMNVSIINYSSAGPAGYNEEEKIFKEVLDRGITIVVPSGNERVDLDKTCNVYPACYDKRLIVVGRNNTEKVGFGKFVDFTEDASDITAFGVKMSGTSQATAIRTGKLIQQMARKK